MEPNKRVPENSQARRALSCEVGQPSANTLATEESAIQAESEGLDRKQVDISSDPTEDMTEHLQATIEKFNRRHCSKECYQAKAS